MNNVHDNHNEDGDDDDSDIDNVCNFLYCSIVQQATIWQPSKANSWFSGFKGSEQSHNFKAEWSKFKRADPLIDRTPLIWTMMMMFILDPERTFASTAFWQPSPTKGKRIKFHAEIISGQHRPQLFSHLVQSTLFCLRLTWLNVRNMHRNAQN